MIKINKRIDGGALYYVIFLSFVLFSIASLFLVLREAKVKHILDELSYFEKKDDIVSALYLYLSFPQKYQDEEKVSITLFEDSLRHVDIERRYWGVIPVIKAVTYFKGKELSRSFFLGSDPYNSDSIALWVSDVNQPIYASGSSHIAGHALLPKGGLIRASVEGKKILNENLVEGKCGKSLSSLPRINKNVVDQLKYWLNTEGLHGQKMNISELKSRKVSQDFLDTSLIYLSSKDLLLSGIDLQGNVAVVSSGTIKVSRDAALEGSIICAKNIIIENGFSGSAQFIARDSIIIHKDCKLEYPSVVCLYNQDVNPVYIEIGESSLVYGSIILSQENLSSKKPRLQLQKDATVIGMLYIDGEVELEGKVEGSLYVTGFYRKTNKAYYYNHLIDNIISFYDLSVNYTMIELIKPYYDQIVEYI